MTKGFVIMTKDFVIWEVPVIRTPAPKRPTDSELAILRILWEKGASTVRQVLAELNQDRATGYTTALKMMHIMTKKELV